ncbi:MAG: LacI family transcriptional regulator [Treponema sp.]|jgi:DNA-binding LacI/PurR family transcriptional regulator|nr:LacI family transcriptional regulator [Treponema sp.]
MVNMKDVAMAAGVSIATVSNVLNKTKKVSPAVEARVLDVVQTMNYKVDVKARALKSKKTMTLGFVVSQLDSIFFPMVIKGIQKVAEEHNYNLIFLPTNLSFNQEKINIKNLISNYVDGIIIDSIAAEDDFEYFRYLQGLHNKSKKIPVVSIQRDMTMYGIPSASLNAVSGGDMATQHLIDKGCRKIASIAGPSVSAWARDRRIGYRAALQRAGIPYSSSYVTTGDCSIVSGYLCTKQFLMNAMEFDGIFAQNDLMAVGAIKALCEKNIDIPNQVKVIGFDNIFVSSIINPSLTTVNIPKQRMGEEGARMLINIINDGSDIKGEKIELPMNLIERQSTNPNLRNEWDIYS